MSVKISSMDKSLNKFSKDKKSENPMTTKTPVGEKYDLLLKGGRVIDPANGIDDFVDLAVAGKYVSNVAKDIPINTARNVIDATGLLITPGLIDLHAHFYGLTGAILPDAHCLSEGTTTAVDAGGAGHLTFDHFDQTIISKSKTNIFALINIVGEGMVGLPEQDLEGMDVDLTSAKIAQRPDRIVGLKVAHYYGPGWEALDRGVQAADNAGVFVMVDQAPIKSRPNNEMLLEHLRPGDITTHCYGFDKPMTDENDKVKNYFFQARDRGVKFDVGHGAGSFSFRIAKSRYRAGLPT